MDTITDSRGAMSHFDRRSAAARRARASTRGELIASGRVLFAERGLHRVTTHDIAAHAGLAAGTFYNHFSDKAALFREITDQALEELIRRLHSYPFATLGLAAAVRARAEALVGFAEEHRELIQILFSGDAEASAIESDVLDHLARTVADERREEVTLGAMPVTIDPEVFAQAMVGMWARVVAWWADDPARAPRESIITTLTHIELGGCHPVTQPYTTLSQPRATGKR